LRAECGTSFRVIPFSETTKTITSKGKPIMAQEGTNTKGPLHFYENTVWRVFSYVFWIGLVSLLILITAAKGLSVPAFGNPRNIQNIAQFWLIFALMVPPMILIIASGGLDLSVGAVIGLTSVIVASMMTNQDMSGAVALLIGLGLAFLIGLVNGLLTGLTRLHGAVVTLGMMALLRGIAISISEGTPIMIKDVDSFSGLTILAVILVNLLTLVTIALAEFTPFGRQRHSELVEGESRLRRLVRTVIAYALSSTMAGLAGILLLSRLRTGMPTLGTGYEVQVILAVFLGGIPLGGGLLNVIGAMLGSLLIVLTQNVAVLNNVPAAAFQIYQGVGLLIFGPLSQGYTLVADWFFRSRSQKSTPAVSPLPAD
jgi:ribose/xylose/arabinose/galactoside ABC-type transport system permease subunit